MHQDLSIISEMRILLDTIRARLRSCPDTEPEQAIVRLAVTTVVMKVQTSAAFVRVGSALFGPMKSAVPIWLDTLTVLQ